MESGDQEIIDVLESGCSIHPPRLQFGSILGLGVLVAPIYDLITHPPKSHKLLYQKTL